MSYTAHQTLPRIASRLILFLPALLAMTACLGALAKRSADREVYPIIAAKQAEALGGAEPFTIDRGTSETAEANARILADAEPTTGGVTISLADALALAFLNNREYQTRRESVYLSALALTGERHDFSPIFSGAIAARLGRRPETPDSRETYGTVAGDFAVTKLFATGARVTVGLTQDLLKVYTGTNERETASGGLAASIVQPILRDGWWNVTLENLRQAERNVVYEVRSFARYQKDFLVDQIEGYFRLLQAQDEVVNERGAYDRLILARERAEALLAADRLDAFEVDQARQDEMSARDRWIRAQTRYVLQLDQFKNNLGLPIEWEIQPDPSELRYLGETALVELSYNLPEAEGLALERRMDYLTALEQVEDRGRKIEVAENSLLPVFDLRADVVVPDTGQNQPLDFNFHQRSESLGVDLELPLDRKDERNEYRRSLIDLDRELRRAEELRNQILIQVREAYENVAEARQSYEVQRLSLELAQRRVENVKMLLELGREGVTVRDDLEAQAALRDAQNDLTRVLVDYTIARLRFYEAIEELEIDEEGSWHEPTTATP